MSISPDIFDFERREGWKGPIGASVGFHGLLIGSILLAGGLAFHSGDSWGGTQQGGAMSATLVSSAIPLPAREAQKEQVLANDSQGLAQSQPKMQPKQEAEAIPIPDRIVKTKPRHEATTPTRPIPHPSPPKPANVVPFGEGGPVSAPMTMFKTETGSGGLAVGAGGAFGARFSWYVDGVRRKISENWLKYEVDPNIVNARRVYLTFDINRDGHPSNVSLSQTSGVPSLDQSAVRALERIDTFGPLPPEYAGSKVSVEFFFDYKK